MLITLTSRFGCLTFETISVTGWVWRDQGGIKARWRTAA